MVIQDIIKHHTANHNVSFVDITSNRRGQNLPYIRKEISVKAHEAGFMFMRLPRPSTRTERPLYDI